ncbi:MAG: hypothetical protein KDA96_15510 [Planctomycetaceae bacterium]|nr:hypothetical protein [Planctomycetaceae bacterium]
MRVLRDNREWIAEVRSISFQGGILSRAGITLTEVLMALMIMSIGISAVAVLFPISMLRSLQANQLTNGAIVKYNVETLLEVAPSMIFDPDGDGDLREHFRNPATRNYIIDPVSFYTHNRDALEDSSSPAATMQLAGWYGNDGGNAIQVMQRFGLGLKTTDGNAGTNISSATALQYLATAIANQGDGWETQVDTVAIEDVTVKLPDGSLGIIGAVVSSEVDLSGTPSLASLGIPFVGGRPLIADPGLFRVVLYSENGKRAQAFPLTNVILLPSGDWGIMWSEDIDGDGGFDADFNDNDAADFRPLPAELLIPDVDSDGNADFRGRVLIQSRRMNDYNWFLTVRRRGDGAVRSVDVVVRYSDGVDPTEERVFQASFAGGSSVIGVKKWADGTEPNILKGKFVFDIVNARWYRIQDVQEKPLFASGSFWSNYDYLVTLETTPRLKDTAGTDGLDGSVDGSAPGGLTFGAAMFPPGIVDVYPMGSIGIPEELK